MSRTDEIIREYRVRDALFRISGYQLIEKCCATCGWFRVGDEGEGLCTGLKIDGLPVRVQCQGICRGWKEPTSDES